MSESAAPQSSASIPAATPFRRAHVIVVGNEKGGSGKTTTTMHLMVALLRLGFTVGSIDIDSRQRSLTRYIENRRQTIANEGVALPTPQHFVIQKSPFDSMEEAKADEKDRFAKGLAKVYGTCDFVVIDTPGNDTYLSRLAHSFASTIITPINDSFVDLDVLASVDGATLNIVKPSIYSEMVWEQKLQRAKRDGGSIDWIVMRNRLSNLDARNKRFMSKVTEELARRIGFRVAPGFSERVIFREMFLQGLTVLDVLETEGGNESKLSISHVAARQEVRNLLAVLKISEVDRRIEKLRTGEEPELPAAPSKPVESSTPVIATPSVKTPAAMVPAASSLAASVVSTPVATVTTATAPSSPSSASSEVKLAVQNSVAPLSMAQKPSEAVSAASGETSFKESAGFAIASEQKLPPAALAQAKAELARATVQHAPKSMMRAGHEALPPETMSRPLGESKADAAASVYPVLPTPSLTSGSPESRAPLLVEPSLPPATKPLEPTGRPAPALGEGNAERAEMKTQPALPTAALTSLEAVRSLPSLSSRDSATSTTETPADTAAETSAPAKPKENVVMRLLSGALN